MNGKLILVEHRIKQAEESLQEAKVLQEQGMSLRSVMNRLYYASFYAVLALLQEKGIGTSKHTGAISWFDREFIRPGLLDKELSKTLHRAFELRQKGDYLEDPEINQKEIEELFPRVIDFVEKVATYVREKK